eukprot:gnl/Chilomastix_caulleri/2985.p1 GENE.gnl/Chilomastix_caulleri/2985~~gnl/Chilomastix_caulleri/2985.p1  ORF type:complete len:152 (+),score=43.01 gnl/Chilomastix_caulleri/2985:139-594(+)
MVEQDPRRRKSKEGNQTKKLDGRLMMEEAGGVLEAAWRGYKFRLCGGIEKCRRDAKRRLKRSRGRGRSRSRSRSGSRSTSRSAPGSSRTPSPLRMGQQSDEVDVSSNPTSAMESTGPASVVSETGTPSSAPRSGISTRPSTGIVDDVVDIR